MKYNKLTIIKDAGKNKYSQTMVLCRCDCGSTTTLRKTVVMGGYVKSCGCLRLAPIPKGEASFNDLYAQYIAGAKRKEREFSLSKDEFRELTSQHCHYCGDSPSKEHNPNEHCNGSYTYNGIDRVDNSLGYTLDNCVPCCSFCNFAKGSGTVQEFLDHAAKIYEHQDSIGAFLNRNIVY